MSRMPISRHGERSSYKASEVLGLFVLSLFLGMAFCLVCVAVDYSLQVVLGIGR